MKQTIKKIIYIAILSVISISLTACSLNNNQIENNSIEFVDGYGYTTIIEKNLERIVSVSPNITEILCSLGLEEKIVGRTEYCDYPETISNIDSVGDILNPNIEKIVELKPDIVISEGMQSSSDFSDSLRNLGIKVINLRTNKTLEGTYESIKNIGIVTSRNEQADQIINNMKKDLLKISEKLENVEKKTVFYIVGFGTYGLSTATGDTFINDILEKAGLINVASDGENWSYNLEKLYEHNPEIIICSKYYNTKQNIKTDEGLKKLKAIQQDQIIEVDNNKIDRQTVRNIEAIKELVEKIYNI